MKKTVSSWAKKNFLYWFIENYSFHNQGPKNILYYLTEDEQLLSQTHLVLDGSYLRPLLVISSATTGLPPLILKTFTSTITDSDLLLARMNLLRNSPLYLTLYFADRDDCQALFAIIEEDPTVLEGTLGRQLLFDFELSLWNDGFKREQKRSELLTNINAALDQRNKSEFEQLAKQYNNL